MLCVPFVIADDVDAEGSGTLDDPYRGSVSDGFYYSDIYIVIGTEVYLDSMGTTSSIDGYMDEGSGLVFYYSKSMYDLTGTASVVGDYNIYLTDRRGNTHVEYTIHVVEASVSVTLEFLSNPITDGTISYGNSAELIVYENANESLSQEGTE